MPDWATIGLATLTALGGFGGIVGTIRWCYKKIDWLIQRVKRIDEVVKTLEEDRDLMLAFTRSRARVEVAKLGYSVVGKRVFIAVKDRVRFAPIEQELWVLASSPISQGDSNSLWKQIETKHGAWIIENICKTIGASSGACLEMALEVAYEKLRATA